MHFKGLDLNLLVVLDALSTDKNTRKAGERIFLGQPGTSMALARLREYFGDPLLVRSGQKMVLTPLAEGLVEPVRQMLAQCENIASYNTSFHPESSKRNFRLNMGDEVAAILMPQVFAKVRESAPGVTLEIQSIPARTELARDLAEYLEKGDLDFLIVPRQIMSPHHPIEELFEEPLVCVVWSGNRHVRRSISLRQYLSFGHVVNRHGPQQTADREDFYFREAGYKRRIEITVPSFGLLASFVIGTDLLATMPESLAKLSAQYLPLKILPLPLPIPPYTMCIQWHRYHDHDPGSRWFRGILKEMAGSLLPSGKKKRTR
jgi:LysR family transcriptional regulator, nod-box dependent transcriptional activator